MLLLTKFYRPGSNQRPTEPKQATNITLRVPDTNCHIITGQVPWW